MKHTEFYASGLPKPETFEQISDTIWSYAETRYHESKSAKLLCEALEQNGFCVTRPYAGIDTCFLAEYGSGRPVIGILGEYDALPGLSQVADCPEKKPVEAGGNGHGCGHHLLGTASLEAVCMLKQLMEQNAIQGTIRYYGCPAEEGGAGKGFMVRAGVFSDVDACITWHPMDVNGVMNHTLANMRMLFDFYGKSAHAAAAPFEGRSALDAVELTDIGCNYLREHVIPEARIHYAITDAGGPAANVVQAHAQEVYCIRAPRQDQVEEIFGRVCNCARGAALMTDTRAEIQVVSAYANIVPNKTLCSIALEKFHEIGADYTAEELEYLKTYTVRSRPIDQDIYHDIPFSGSTDVGDVSWVTPTISITTACYAAGTVMHSWQATAQGKSSVAKKGMHRAAQIMAAIAAALFQNKEQLAQVKQDFNDSLEGKTYHSLLPAELIPGDF